MSSRWNRFRVTLAAHAAGLCVTAALIALVAANTSYYATLLLLCLILAGQVAALSRYIDRTNRELARFLAAVRHDDFSQAFVVDRPGGSFDQLAGAFDELLARFRDARLRTAEQTSYLQTLVQHIPIAVIVFEESGRVDLFNNAARRLLGVPDPGTLAGLAGLDATLPERLRGLRPGRPELIALQRDHLTLSLSGSATELRMSGRQLRLVTLQDIHRELEAREAETWLNLARVLTHEIMNSVTPISSLAGTTAALLEQSADGSQADDLPLADVRDAVDTIAARSAGLLRFADSYRRLTRLPAPVLRTFQAADLLARVHQLVQPELARHNITSTVRVVPSTLELTADSDLLEQALLNLLKNAMDALQGRSDGTVRLSAETGPRGQVIVSVADDGAGMSDLVKANLFTPFYTTKQAGTGIGLSLVQQIMRAHGGGVTVDSEAGAGTTVRLRF